MHGTSIFKKTFKKILKIFYSVELSPSLSLSSSASDKAHHKTMLGNNYKNPIAGRALCGLFGKDCIVAVVLVI